MFKKKFLLLYQFSAVKNRRAIWPLDNFNAELFDRQTIWPPSSLIVM